MSRKNTILAALFAMVALAFTSRAAIANDEQFWTITPEPVWGSQAQVPANETASQYQGGKTYHLVESHHNYSDTSNKTAFYTRVVYKINNTSGLESSDPVSIEYDPLYERVEFHQARIHRNGKIIDQLLQGQTVRQLQREKQLDDGLYDGHETLHLILDDQRVGDKIEFSYSIVGVNPVYKNHVFGWRRMQTGIPVGNYYFRLRYPQDKKVATKVFSGTLPVTKESADGYEIMTWENHNTKATEYQSDTPASFLATTYIQYSDFADWPEVSQWAAPLYTLPQKTSAAVKSKAAEIVAINSNTKAQIEDAIRFVQDEIRYTGLNSGIGGYVPDPTDKIMQRRFGDCKDKSMLITALLREFGVTAYPTLVHSYNGPEISTYLPSPDAFDHMIVSLPFEGNTYWIDGTMALQGTTLESIQQGNYNVALIPGQAASGLQSYTAKQSLPSKKLVDEKYQLAENHKEKQSQLTIKTTLHGSEAEYMRAKLERDGAQEIEQRYLDFYKEKFGTVELAASMKIEDNRKANIVTLTEDYMIDDIWQVDINSDTKKEQFIINLDADEVYYALQMPDDKRRFQPIAQTHPVEVKYRAVVHDDSGWDTDEISENINNKHFSYHSKVYSAGTVLILNYEVKSKLDVVSVADSTDYIKDLKAMLADTGYHLFYTSPAQRKSNGDDSLLSIIADWIRS